MISLSLPPPTFIYLTCTFLGPFYLPQFHILTLTGSPRCYVSYVFLSKRHYIFANVKGRLVVVVVCVCGRGMCVYSSHCSCPSAVLTEDINSLLPEADNPSFSTQWFCIYIQCTFVCTCVRHTSLQANVCVCVWQHRCVYPSAAPGLVCGCQSCWRSSR